MELVLIKPESIEWNYIWQWLENHPINKDIENPTLATNNGESWQYMGSYKQGNRLLHSLRHRCHPLTDRVETLSLQNSTEFTLDQIYNEYKL